MRITWRDTTTIIAIAAAIGMMIAGLIGIIPDNITSWRAATLLLVVLGIGIYVTFGPTFLPQNEPWRSVSATLQVLAFVLSAFTLIASNKLSFIILVLVFLGLWILAAMHHIRGNNDHMKRGGYHHGVSRL